MNNDDNAPSFKYKASLITNTEADGTKKEVKIAVPLKYLSTFWRSVEMPLINCKTEFSLKWTEDCVLTEAPIGADAPLVQVVQLLKELMQNLMFRLLLISRRQCKIVKTINQRI